MKTFLFKLKTSIVAAATLALLTCSACALDIQWPDGRLWTDVDVTDLTGASVTLFHGTRATTMLIADLPPDAQQKVRSAWAQALKRRAAIAGERPGLPTPPPPDGADITLRNGEVFHHARILSVDAATASIMHETGIARVSLGDLPDALRVKVAPGYTPQAATAYLAQEEQAQRAAAAAQAQADAAAALDARVKPLWFDGTVKQITEEGIIATGRVYVPGGEFPTYKMQRSGLWKQEGTVDWQVYDDMMILGVADDSLVDGSAWKGTVYAIGHYQFTTVLGAPRTIPGFTASKAAAREYVAK